MANGIEKANGHRPSGLLHLLDPSLRLAPHPDQSDLPFDLDQALSSVFRLTSEVPEEAFSARTLGIERQGNAIVIGGGGLMLTIGYLVVDADEIILHGRGGRTLAAELLGYNHESGFAVIRSLEAPEVPPLPRGSSKMLREGDPAIIAPYGGADHAISGAVVSRREFAGSWEYMLDHAIFTAPIHPNWSGAALIDGSGQLVGVGSLWVNDAEPGSKDSPGNMFVPIDLLEPILDDLINKGFADVEPRPWLGMYTSEAMRRLFVSGVIPEGPADIAGVEAGDLVSGVADQPVTKLSEMYRMIWGLGGAGTEVLLNLRRNGEDMDVTVTSDSRYRFMQQRRPH